jgi:hypothetical protein
VSAASFDDLWIGEPNSGCHLWLGTISNTARRGAKPNYRPVFVSDRRNVFAYRAAWEAANGAIPAGASVCHRCDVPLCVNVDHLFVGTQADNIRDAAAKDRIYRASTRTHCKHGHPFDEQNTRLWFNQRKTGGEYWARICRTCAREATRRQTRKKRDNR